MRSLRAGRYHFPKDFTIPVLVVDDVDVEEFSLAADVTPEQIACRAHDEVLWDRRFDYDWQRLLHWCVKLRRTRRPGYKTDCGVA